ncbi:MAG: HlyD family secretion protein, partial [Citrobacter sp.]
VFSARVTSSDAGILAGQEQVNGLLSQPEQSTRWVRDAQRMRIRVALNEPLDTPLPTGAQIHLVSWLHYVY